MSNKPEWTKQVVEHLEKNAFYKGGDRKTPLARDCDRYINDYLRQGFKEGYSLIDFACGTGRLRDLNGVNQYSYTGYDSSPEMIKLAKEKFPDICFIDKMSNMLKDNQKITLTFKQAMALGF